jgi:hypothetical protein
MSWRPLDVGHIAAFPMFGGGFLLNKPDVEAVL